MFPTLFAKTKKKLDSKDGKRLETATTCNYSDNYINCILYLNFGRDLGSMIPPFIISVSKYIVGTSFILKATRVSVTGSYLLISDIKPLLV